MSWDTCEPSRILNATSNSRKKRLSKNVVQAEQFKIGGEIGINAILSKMLVVFYVVFLVNAPAALSVYVYSQAHITHLERSGIRYAYW